MEYQEYEFCKAKKCWKYFENKCLDIGCQYTAKEYHKWLKENSFKIIKKTPNKALDLTKEQGRDKSK